MKRWSAFIGRVGILPYTGLKAAGRDFGPAIPAADKALETGSDEALIKLLTSAVQQGLRKHFNEAMERKNFAPDNVAAGREYVESYVSLYGAAEKRVSGHYADTD